MSVSDELDLSGAVPLDTFTLPILRPGTDTPTGWQIVLAGPGHPQTIALQTDISRENIEREKAIEFAQINGRKWKVEEETVDQRRRRNVSRVCRRIVSWSPNPKFKLVSETPIAFTPEAALELFIRPEMGSFLVQITDYIASERAFMPPSEPI